MKKKKQKFEFEKSKSALPLLTFCLLPLSTMYNLYDE